MKRYVVIRGQYESHATEKDTFDSLHAAKCYATKYMEYWDNWQGWHTPSIYLAEDCMHIVAKEMVTVWDGKDIIVPRTDREIHPVYYKQDGKWVENK